MHGHLNVKKALAKVWWKRFLGKRTQLGLELNVWYGLYTSAKNKQKYFVVLTQILKYFCLCHPLSGEHSCTERLCESCNAANLSRRTFS